MGVRKLRSLCARASRSCYLWRHAPPLLTCTAPLPRLPHPIPCAGQGRGFGLEVGSKAELLMVMSLLAGTEPGANLVCNGFKVWV